MAMFPLLSFVYTGDSYPKCGSTDPPDCRSIQNNIPVNSGQKLHKLQKKNLFKRLKNSEKQEP